MTREELFKKLKTKIILNLEGCKDSTMGDEYLDEDIIIAQKSKTFKGLFRAIPGWNSMEMYRFLIGCLLESDKLGDEMSDLIDDTW